VNRDDNCPCSASIRIYLILNKTEHFKRNSFRRIFNYYKFLQIYLLKPTNTGWLFILLTIIITLTSCNRFKYLVRKRIE